MIPLLQSGKFWLKLMVYGTIAAVLLFIPGIISLHYLFNAERIQQQADENFATTRHRLRFDHNISRSWFPRPTVTLYHVQMRNIDNKQTDIDMGSMRIGLAWSSLFGQKRIEKWQWKEARINLYRTPNGQWNLHDVVQRWQQQPNHTPINRIVIDQGDVRLTDDQGKVQQFSQIQARIDRLNTADSPLQASGQWQREHNPPVTWALEATQHSTPWQWRNATLNMTAELPQLGLTKATWHFQGSWQTQPLRLLMRDVQWQSQSQRAHLQLNGTGKDWQIGATQTYLPQTNAVITAQQGDNTINATLSLNKLRWQAARWQIDQFQLDSGWQNRHNQSALIINGRLLWGPNQQWLVDNLTISSHQDTVNQLPNPRWLSEVSGQIAGQGNRAASLSLQGTFDNQPVQLSAQYRNTARQTEISGALNVNQLNLTPYLPNNGPIKVQPAWLMQWRNWLHQRHVQWQIRIGRVLSNMGQIADFSSHIDATDKRITIDPFETSLYGGTSRGRFSIDNSQPLRWQMQQYLQNIQIKPLLQDSFGFHNLDGEGDAQFLLSSEGMNNRDWVAHLNGSAHLRLQQGTLRGIDINNILQTRQNLSTTLAFNEGSQTPFQSLQLLIPLNNGYSQQSHVSLSAGNFSVDGEGLLNLPQRSMRYDVMIDTRQAGKRNKLPLRISGNLSQPIFSLDYQRLTAGLQTADQKQKTLSQTFRQQWQWLNQGSRPNRFPSPFRERKAWPPIRP